MKHCVCFSRDSGKSWKTQMSSLRDGTKPPLGLEQRDDDQHFDNPYFKHNRLSATKPVTNKVAAGTVDL